jgi:hypothetical protein
MLADPASLSARDQVGLSLSLCVWLSLKPFCLSRPLSPHNPLPLHTIFYSTVSYVSRVETQALVSIYPSIYLSATTVSYLSTYPLPGAAGAARAREARAGGGGGARDPTAAGGGGGRGGGRAGGAGGGGGGGAAAHGGGGGAGGRGGGESVEAEGEGGRQGNRNRQPQP